MNIAAGDDDLSLHSTSSCSSYTETLGGSNMELNGQTGRKDDERCQIKNNNKKNQIILRIKWVLILVLSMVALGMGIALCLSLQHAPTQDFKKQQPMAYAIALMVLFAVTVAAFVFFEMISQRRHDVILSTALRSNAVLTSMFPKQVRERILEDAEARVMAKKPTVEHNKKGTLLGAHQKSQLKLFLNDHEKEKGKGGEALASGLPTGRSKPIADLFPSTTVMFADIAGFTAWSSVREPCHVFELLECLYSAFDKIAQRRRIYKVETIGDSYVAVSGVPEPNEKHAVTMARFANDIRRAMNDLTKELERTLGPDTVELSLRIGLNSGPVTAGVLRGANCRFQLFGDTVNTASRMESTGVKNKIQISSTTKDLLEAAGKGNWAVPRVDKVSAKGLGVLSTFWLDLKQQSSRSHTSSDGGAWSSTENMREQFALARSESVADIKLPSKTRRLVEWNVDVLSNFLKDLVARRIATKKYVESTNDPRVSPSTCQSDIETLECSYLEGGGSNPYDEVKEVIRLPRFIPEAARIEATIRNDVKLDTKVVEQLRSYVTVIASMYRDVPFHNYEHASHVMMSTIKLLSRIRSPEEVLSQDTDDKEKLSQLNDFTFGITSSPLTQFTLVLSALIHDVGHEGVPNATLVAEDSPLAKLYRGKSVAEQNSIDIAWNLLMDPAFKDLRAVIYTKEVNLKRFRQLLVNATMATDIADKELKNLRNARWDATFSRNNSVEGEVVCKDEEELETVHRKANIVIEHLMQASDISHTMQHWHVYRKWNERFFEENIRAFQQGRAERNPADYWYHGELGFFDFYIIPLAKKLKECGIFGVSSDEYLSYAEMNRNEWQARGKEVVAEMAAKYLSSSSPSLDNDYHLGGNDDEYQV